MLLLDSFFLLVNIFRVLLIPFKLDPMTETDKLVQHNSKSKLCHAKKSPFIHCERTIKKIN